MQGKKGALPPVGMRIIKSAIGVLLVFIIHHLRGESGTPFNSAVSVLWCMQPCVSEIKSKSFQRTIGTLVGATFGLIMIMMQVYILPPQQELLRDVLIACFIIPVIYTTILINKTNASYFSCAVFLSIAINHLSDSNPYIFVVNRVVDTLIGIGLAYVINTVRLPRRKQNHILFVSELDEVLLDSEATMTPYSRFELNRMLEHGAQFTIATMRPPASLIPVLKGIDIKLPVIAMDGAILYDIKQNKVIKKLPMTYDEVKQFIALFKANGYHCFVNSVIEDSIVIYYHDFKNPVEKALYEKLHTSPYRNYIKAPFLEKGEPIYLVLIDTHERMDSLYRILVEQGYADAFKILKYPSKDYIGYTYIKIFNKNACKKNMLKEFQHLKGIEKIVTLGEREQIGDGTIKGEDANHIVKNFRRAYEPYIWQCRKSKMDI